jgi:hypothetical protein
MCQPKNITEEIKSHKGIIVLRFFQDYSPEQFWLLDMTAKEIETWWAAQTEFWWPVTPESQALCVLFGEKPEPLRAAMELPGKFLNTENDPEAERIWTQMDESKKFHRCQLCCDSDSFLIAPGERYLFHQGYSGPILPR